MDNQNTIINLLKKCDLFSELREHELEIIKDYCEFLHFDEEQEIFREGRQAKRFFIIKEGQVRIVRNAKINPQTIAIINVGESFGELDVFERTTRTATAFAEMSSTVLAFPKGGITLKEFFENNHRLAATILHKFVAFISQRIEHINQIVYEKKQWAMEIKKILYTDKLTGLYNISYLNEDFAQTVEKTTAPISILYIKPDNFKQINDNYGHTIGDRVLHLLSIFLNSAVDSEDIVVRYRGDEFVIILIDTNREEALQKAEQIKNICNEMELGFLLSDEYSLSASIGIAKYEMKKNSFDWFIKKAYDMMISARQTGGNKIISFN